MNALDLANSFRAPRGHVRDDLDPRLGLHPLRDAIRRLFQASADGAVGAPEDVELLNRLARAPRLAWDGLPAVVEADQAAEAARTAIELLAAGGLQRCGNPRCVLFVTGGRRSYCSVECSNRVRAARHAARVESR